jgi:hypothetical protein
MVRHNAWTIVIDDIRRAFDNVRIDVAMTAHRRFIQDAELLNLIETILRGHNGPGREIGIDQGGAYSPTALNVTLDATLDKPLFNERLRRGLRYADNIALIGLSLTECRDLPLRPARAQ